MKPAKNWIPALCLLLMACGDLLKDEDDSKSEGDKSDPGEILQTIFGIEQPDTVKTVQVALKAEVTAPENPPSEFARMYASPTHLFIWRAPETAGAVYDLAKKGWAGIPVTEELTTVTAVTATDRGLFVLGEKASGEDKETTAQALLLFDPVAGAWEVLSVAGAPSPRKEALAAKVGDEIYILGGYSGKDTFEKTTGIYSMATDQWRAGPEIPHEGPATDFLKDRMFAVSDKVLLYVEEPNLYELDLAAQTWSKKDLSLSTYYQERLYHVVDRFAQVPNSLSAGSAGTEFLGRNKSDTRDDWLGTADYPDILGRDEACVGIYKSFVVFWGGHLSNSITDGTYGKGGSFADGWALDTKNDRWAYLQAPEGARARGRSACAVIGGTLAVWGGEKESEQWIGGTDEKIQDLMLMDLSPLDALPAPEILPKGKLSGTPLECAAGETRIQGTLGGRSIDLRQSGNYAWSQSIFSIFLGSDQSVALRFTDMVPQGSGAIAWAQVQLPGSGVTGSNCLFEEPVSEVRVSEAGTFQFIVRGIKSGSGRLLDCGGTPIDGELFGCARSKNKSP